MGRPDPIAAALHAGLYTCPVEAAVMRKENYFSFKLNEAFSPLGRMKLTLKI